MKDTVFVQSVEENITKGGSEYLDVVVRCLDNSKVTVIHGKIWANNRTGADPKRGEVLTIWFEESWWRGTKELNIKQWQPNPQPASDFAWPTEGPEAPPF